tara:strand:+ start:98 stop:373 length:276 start_codon:yes stop_codon:yes gene_type:complete
MHTIKTVKIDLDADFILQAYTRDVVCIDGVQKLSDKKRVIACFTTFKDFEDSEEQLDHIMNLRWALLKAYESYCDGEVAVELTIKDGLVNE